MSSIQGNLVHFHVRRKFLYFCYFPIEPYTNRFCDLWVKLGA